jgi:hypothetical protein
LKAFNTIAAMLVLGTAAIAQTTPVTPVITNGQIQVTVQDSSGGSHALAFPVTTSLSVGQGTDVYTGPVVVTPPPPPPSGAPAIPSNAIAVDLINPKNAWKNTKDAGTPGTATFSNNYPVTGIFFDASGKSIDTRAFSIAYSGAAGVRFSNSFAKDTTATHFVYDVVVQSPDWTHTANLEMDINQVKSNGKTAILGVQCSNYSKTWEVTFLTSTGSWHWVPTNAPCTPLKWSPNEPHHIRIFGIMDPTGVSTYLGAEFDGTYQTFTGAVGQTEDALGWTVGTVLPNFQIDGLGASGSATIYSDRLTIIRW